MLERTATSHNAALAAADAAARERALDVSGSFLVQAPAGSGKTELLIQRFLALLARVDMPERIVAMTFTRKAAGEMRERIVAALRDSADATPVDTAHAQRTRELALEALAQDRRHGWQLAAHPARLQLHTIDALCASLARQAPLATGFGATPRFDEHCGPRYEQAARQTLLAAAPDDPAWRRLLAHLDNDADRVVELLADMLAKRDQWLGLIAGQNVASFRAQLEGTLATEIAGELRALRARFPQSVAKALVPLQRYASRQLALSGENPALARSLAACADHGGLPDVAVTALDNWCALAQWLLRTDAAVFLKTMNTSKGFPAKGNGDGAADRDAENGAVRALLNELAAVPGLAAALDVARRLPPPRYGDDAWEAISALLVVLPQVAAQLAVVFRDAGSVDFTHASLAALDALGTTDAPTDLLLRLDLRLQHLLIDEFQDTSYTQLELIRRLTAGWQADDGRTLFAVGDPMQSIYKFRQSEVRLFVEAQEHGCVGDVPVECLILRRNFRADAALVEWVNRIFPRVLGPRGDPWRGIVAFAPAVATRGAVEEPAATIDLVSTAAQEASAVVDRLRAALAAGDRNIAILVRARTHLDTLLPALRAAGIPFTAVELDHLAERQAILDVASLTHALVQPADRLAWLAVLRAPWCGLTLHDLFAIVAAADTETSGSIADLLPKAPAIPGLSDDGRARFTRLASALTSALAGRGRVSLSAQVRGAWLALAGPACVAEAVDVSAAERFFSLLGEHEHAGDLADWSAFITALADLCVEPDADPVSDAAAQVKVMTLHRAKGLEFDTVILPGLAREPNRSDVELLRWRRRPHGLLLAPLKASSGTDDPVYRYLQSLNADEQDAELGRLLYVGCTRAKHRLHLVAALDTMEDVGGSLTWRVPPQGSGLARLWDALESDVPGPAAAPVARVATPVAAPSLYRLPGDWQAPHALPGVRSPSQSAITSVEEVPPFDWAREVAKHVGTVAHRLFRQIGDEGIGAWPVSRVASVTSRIQAELAHEGVDASAMKDAAQRVQAAVLGLLGDTRGRWLLDSAHREARSEYALTVTGDGALVNVVVDRTFIDADNIRWIIDFKLSHHEGGGVDSFLDNECERYRPQLERYARALRAFDQREIRLGLYFPLHAGWREWAASA